MKIRSIALFALFVLLGSCIDKYPGEPLVIENNTNSRVYYWFSYWESDNFSNYHFPDTILPSEKPIHLNSIAPHNSTGDGEEDPDWEKIFNELPQGKFSIYFFEIEPKNQSDWDAIITNYSTFRKDVSYADFMANNYRISYP